MDAAARGQARSLRPVRLEHLRAGSGEPLVLLHGIGDSSHLWSPVLPLLGSRRECWALDLPGFGGSPPLVGAEPAPPALARAVAGFMAEQGVERFHVAGNSLGGGVALELGILGVARSVCALSPIGFAEGWERGYLQASLIATRLIGRASFRSLDRPAVRTVVQRLPPAQMVAHGRHMSYDDLAVLLRRLALAPGFRATVPLLADYRFQGSPSCPTTVAWGDRDRLNLFGPQSRRARTRLPDARHVTLTNCGHLPTWDDPAAVADVVLDASEVRP